MFRWVTLCWESASRTRCREGSLLSKGCSESYARESESWLPGGKTTSQPRMGKQVSEYLGLKAARTNFIDICCFLSFFISFFLLVLFLLGCGFFFSWNARLKGGGTEPRTLRKRYLIHSVEGLWFLDSEETIGWAEIQASSFPLLGSSW